MAMSILRRYRMPERKTSQKANQRLAIARARNAGDKTKAILEQLNISLSTLRRREAEIKRIKDAARHRHDLVPQVPSHA